MCTFPALYAAGIDVVLTLGWFILLCSLCVRRPEDSGFERKPHRPISLLPAAIHCTSFSNIATNRIDWFPGLDRSRIPLALPYLSSITL